MQVRRVMRLRENGTWEPPGLVSSDDSRGDRRQDAGGRRQEAESRNEKRETRNGLRARPESQVPSPDSRVPSPAASHRFPHGLPRVAQGTDPRSHGFRVAKFFQPEPRKLFYPAALPFLEPTP